MSLALLMLAIVAFILLLYRGQAYAAWTTALGLALLAWWFAVPSPSFVFHALLVLFVAAAVVFGVPSLRRSLLTRHLMAVAKGFIPRMSDTERTALDAGTVWWDGELFSGDPDWRKLLDYKVSNLSAAEAAFLAGPVETLCRQLDDWRISQARDIPTEVWEILRRDKFLGMIIPEAYGGLGFSAIGHSAVVVKVASRSIPVACTLMVPNSLGPAELLLHYGTQAQRDHYLPRLARGDEIPCFALTEPHAGSDAAASRSTGVVCRGTFDGREVLGLRLDFTKRYITLAPVATVIGLAFAMVDPDGLLGGRRDLGLTCALVPRDTPGLSIGDRHDPMGVPFPNGPITGKDVFIPLDFVIGGRDGIGQGWRMLMECLAAGRSISLPALSVAAVEVAVRVTSAYASVREQFGLPIGRFEGIEEVLTRIAGHAYLMNSVRTLTCGAIDGGERPAVLSGVAKAYLTDCMRACVSDAMDVLAGSGICRGPRNILSRIYVAAPIGITVEGANILTRSLIIFGQGSVRCHPFVRDEMLAVERGDLELFDRSLFSHLGSLSRNAVRALLLALAGGGLVRVDGIAPSLAPRLAELTRLSTAFALVTDIALFTLGGALKRQEKLSGRLADALAWLYLASAAVKRFHDDGAPESDRPLLDWSCDLASFRIEQALAGVLDNFPNRFAGAAMRFLVFPLGARRRPPHDATGAEVARALLDDGSLRHRLTADIFVPDGGEDGLATLETALDRVVEARDAQRKVQAAMRSGRLDPYPQPSLIDRALALGILSAEEAACSERAARAQDRAIEVDAFLAANYAELKG
jgi:acyl-CoA dehydrogenase